MRQTGGCPRTARDTRQLWANSQKRPAAAPRRRPFTTDTTPAPGDESARLAPPVRSRWRHDTYQGIPFATNYLSDKPDALATSIQESAHLGSYPNRRKLTSVSCRWDFVPLESALTWRVGGPAYGTSWAARWRFFWFQAFPFPGPGSSAHPTGSSDGVEARTRLVAVSTPRRGWRFAAVTVRWRHESR
jgi:hypothetical protein